MEIPIDTHNRLVVKFGKEYAEESDEVVVIPEEAVSYTHLDVYKRQHLSTHRRRK